jgi:hypothetical protein
MSIPAIICFSNIGYKNFADNFLMNIVDKVHNHKVIYYCLDDEIYDYLVSKYKKDNILIERFHNNTENLKQFEHYGSSNFVKLMDTKMDLIKYALQKYNFIHVVDADIVFLHELTESYYETYKEYDIVYQRDAPPPNQPFHEWTCTGNWLLRNTKNTLDFLDKIIEFKSKFSNFNEQEAQREVFRSVGVTDIRNYPYAKITEFPDTEFACGYYVRENAYDIDKLLVFHANHVTGYENKKSLLKKINMWYLLEN